jgi:hypothetical protein
MVHDLAAAGRVPTIACASRIPPVATPRVSGDFIPTLPSSDWTNSRILPRRFVFIQVHLLSFYRKSHSGGIRFPTVVRKPISSEKWLFTKKHSSLEKFANGFN